MCNGAPRNILGLGPLRAIIRPCLLLDTELSLSHHGSHQDHFACYVHMMMIVINQRVQVSTVIQGLIQTRQCNAYNHVALRRCAPFQLFFTNNSIVSSASSRCDRRSFQLLIQLPLFGSAQREFIGIGVTDKSAVHNIRNSSYFIGFVSEIHRRTMSQRVTAARHGAGRPRVVPYD